MSLSLKNFVDININYYKNVSANGIKDTAVLIVTDTNVTVTIADASQIITTADQVTFTGAQNNNLNNFVKLFFNNGGQKLHIIKGAATKATLKALPDEEIIVGFDADFATVKALAQEIQTENTTSSGSDVILLKGIKEKILFTSSLTAASDTDITNIDYLVIKHGNPGIEATMMAYFTKMNVYKGTIQDYCYTPETTKNITTFTRTIIEADDTFKALNDKNINFNIELSNYGEMAYGGNKTNGHDVVNDFTKIVLTQTLTQKIVGILSNKLRYNQTGLSLVSGVITDELQNYKNYGYLTTDKVWTYEDLYDESGQYLIIAKNTSLSQGYTFKILPFSSLTNEEKQAHKLPAIYLIIADSYSVRAIEISGTIL